jgi:hypothetical protein
MPRALSVTVISQSLLIKLSRHCANQSGAKGLRFFGVRRATTTLVSRKIIAWQASSALSGEALLHHRWGEGHGGLKPAQISDQSRAAQLAHGHQI